MRPFQCGVAVSLAVLCLLTAAAIPAVAQSSRNPERATACKTEQLSASQLFALDAAAGHRVMTIALWNRSTSPCVLEGVPVVGFADKVNVPVPVHVCSNCPAHLYPAQPVRPVVLSAKQPAYLLVAYTVLAGNEGCKEAATFSIHIGGQRKPIKLEVGGMRTCGVVDVTPFLEKLPVKGLAGSESGDAEK